MAEYTDAQLVEAIERGVKAGTIIEVTPEWLAAQRAAAGIGTLDEADGDLEAEAGRHIARAAEYDITLARSDFQVIDNELFLDGMDPDEWIDAMTMD